jgi:predicted metal-dependent hydrolase
MIVQGKGFKAHVIRTNRIKTASVRVEEGVVSIVVPEDLSETRIEDVISNKTKWILEKLLLYSDAAPTKLKEYVSGESFPYLGRNYRLKVIAEKWQPAKLLNGRLVVWLSEGKSSPERVRAALIGWYKDHSRNKLREKSSRYAKIVGVSPASINIKTFQSRWGSCHSDGKIQFNWKIIMAPNRIVDYVVVHELCHLKQPDHSSVFWKEVGQVIPGYQECREWLKENGRWLEV